MDHGGGKPILVPFPWSLVSKGLHYSRELVRPLSTVKNPSPESVSTRPLALSGVTSVERCGMARSTIVLPCGGAGVACPPQGASNHAVSYLGTPRSSLTMMKQVVSALEPASGGGLRILSDTPIAGSMSRSAPIVSNLSPPIITPMVSMLQM